MVNKGVIRQYWVATAGSLCIMSVGITLGWTSPIMEELLGPSSPVPMTVDQYSWFVSLHNWAVMLGSVPFSVIADRWGRRATLRALGPMSLATWAAVLFVDTAWGLMAVRLAQGVLMAGAYTVVPVYTGEIAGPKIRGALGTMFQVMLHAGIVFAYAAGACLDFRRMTYAALAFHAAAAGATYAGIPETPHYYAMKGRRADAKRSIEWLRGGGGGGGGSVEGELDAMLADNDPSAGGKRPASLAELFADPVSRRSLILVQALSLFRITAGPMVITSYASVTFAEMRVDAAVAGQNALALVFGALLLVATVAFAAVADRAGRRPLMIVSSLLCAAANAAIAACMYADHARVVATAATAGPPSGHGWWCAAAAAGLAVAYCAGLGSLFGTINCELFPCHTRAAANAVNTVTLTAASFAALKLYPVVAEGGRMYRDFAAFSAGSVVAAATCWLWLPETRGKTFAAIQAQLRGR